MHVMGRSSLESRVVLVFTFSRESHFVNERDGWRENVAPLIVRDREPPSSDNVAHVKSCSIACMYDSAKQ